MTMPSSGQLNMAQTTSPVSVAYELSRGLTSTISMNDSDVRSLAGVGGSGTSWSMSSLYGKSAFTPSLAGLGAYGSLYAESYSPGAAATAQIIFGSDGSWTFYGESLGNTSGNWGTPTTSGVGSGYWIQWTRTFFSGGPGNTATTTSGWQQLNTSRIITVYNAGATNTTTGDYTINISNSSGGSPVLTSASITFAASSNIF